MNVTIKEKEEQTIAFVRKTGPYGKEPHVNAFNTLFDWSGPKGLCKSGEVIAIYWDNPEDVKPEDCRMDACITVPKDTTAEDAEEVNISSIPAGQYAVCNFELTEGEFASAWIESMNWVTESDYDYDMRPFYELYHNDPKDNPDNKINVDICIAIK